MLGATSPALTGDVERTVCVVSPSVAHDSSTWVPAGAGDERELLASTCSPDDTDMDGTVIDNTLTPAPPPLGGGGGSVSVCSQVSPCRLGVRSRPPKRTMVRRGASNDMAWEKRGRDRYLTIRPCLPSKVQVSRTPRLTSRYRRIVLLHVGRDHGRVKARVSAEGSNRVKRISNAGIAAKQDDEVVHQVEGQRVMPSRRSTCVLLLGPGQAVPLPGVVENTSCRTPHQKAPRGHARSQRP